MIFNTLSLLFPLIGVQTGSWWLDPVGAGLLSLYIIYDWASTCVENVARLTGVGVDEAILKKLMYMTWRFSPIVDGYKYVLVLLLLFSLPSPFTPHAFKQQPSPHQSSNLPISAFPPITNPN